MQQISRNKKKQHSVTTRLRASFPQWGHFCAGFGACRLRCCFRKILAAIFNFEAVSTNWWLVSFGNCPQRKPGSFFKAYPIASIFTLTSFGICMFSVSTKHSARTQTSGLASLQKVIGWRGSTSRTWPIKLQIQGPHQVQKKYGFQRDFYDLVGSIWQGLFGRVYLVRSIWWGLFGGVYMAEAI